jgi:hypothetical protein
MFIPILFIRNEFQYKVITCKIINYKTKSAICAEKPQLDQHTDRQPGIIDITVRCATAELFHIHNIQRDLGAVKMLPPSR